MSTPLFNPIPFTPPSGLFGLLKNRHIQTLLPRFVPEPMPKYQRQLHLDSTGKACVAYDFVISHRDNNAPLAVLFHGLEGGSSSHYAKSFANHARKLRVNAVVVHYRGCGGIENPSDLDYNAGDIQELHYVLARLAGLYSNLWAVGVSLGGNMLAKYLGEYGDDALCQTAVIVSAPVDLMSSAEAMKNFVARRIYTPYLLGSLIKKARKKLDKDSLVALEKLTTLDAFDDLYTAPRHGYGTAKAYYKQASALPVMGGITKPTLVISADDDPFLGKVAQPSDVSASVQLLYSKHGGHVGFLAAKAGQGNTLALDNHWLSRTAFEFFASAI